MMEQVRALLVFLSACGFRGQPELPATHDASVIDTPQMFDAITSDARGIDAASGPDAIAIPDAKPAFACDGFGIKACFRFDNNTSDSSSNNVPLAINAGT